MRCAIVADIHANLLAFEAVLGDMERHGGVGEIWCLGDIVGYGPDPHQCLELLWQYQHVCVAGNHDLAAVGKIDTSEFNVDAAAAAKWTAGQLSRSDIQYLENLPLTLGKGDFTLVHGSPREPIWEYVISTSVALGSFPFFKTPFCLVGHSHEPAVFQQLVGSCVSIPFSPDSRLLLGKDRMIINPGGVGQPRDGNPRASYAIYDSEDRVIRLYRVAYDIGATQDKMMQAGLPISLVIRLREGW